MSKTKPDCGCVVALCASPDGTKVVDKIHFCPKHAAAGAMYEALKGLLRLQRLRQYRGYVSPGEWKPKIEAGVKALALADKETEK